MCAWLSDALVLFGQAEAIVLLSDEPDDSEVLLVSFELEQLLGEMELGESTPKVKLPAMAIGRAER